MSTGTRDGNSAGQMLRLLRDSKLFHIEAAIAGVRRVKTEVKSEVLLIPTRTVDADAMEQVDKSRVLSLSDHKRIASLQAALNTVANGYDDQDDRRSRYNHNLVNVVAGAAMMQSMQDCTASRTNCCIWGPHAKKYHVLLNWMMSYELEKEENSLVNCDYLRQLLLGWTQPTAEKQKQLAACLMLFELLQRRRRTLTVQNFQRKTLCPLGNRVDGYVDALRGIIDRGTYSIADSHCVKPSKLALVALETLGLLCGDVATQYLAFDDAAKASFLMANRLMSKVVKGMHFFLDKLRKWHSHSIRRQFLCFALQHMQSYVLRCDTVLSSVNGADKIFTNANRRVFLDVLCWHWVTAVPVFCSRTDVYSRKLKHRSSELLAQVLDKWTDSSDKFNCFFGRDNACVNFELISAQVRYVCILLDSMGGVQGCFKALNFLLAEAKANFVWFFVQSLGAAMKNSDNATIQISVNIFRILLLPKDSLNLLSSRYEEQGFLSVLLRLNDNSLLACTNSVRKLKAQQDLEFFIADFIISRGLSITELLCDVHEMQFSSLKRGLSLVRTFLYQLDGSAAQTPLYRHWRKQLSQGVSELITHEDHSIRRLAYSCLPSLDAVYCIACLTAVGYHEPENRGVSSALEYLFKISTLSSLKAIVTWIIDACQYGSINAHLFFGKAPASPNDWSDYAIQLGKSNNDKQIKTQGKLIAFFFGVAGLSRHVKFAHARHVFLRVLLRKFLGSPRDPVLLRMLRELTVCGWVGVKEFNVIATQICSRVMNSVRLTEELLDSDLPSATDTVKDLLFSRLAPLLVLRMLPKIFFKANCLKILLCGREDLDHLNAYIDRQLQLDDSHPEANSNTTIKVLFHILARSILDPLEFKEVKVLATECLSTFPSSLVLPFVLANVVAFVREAIPHERQDCSLIVPENHVPNFCGLVTAKLMVYYLNRVFLEDEDIYATCDASSKAIALFVQILTIPSDDILLTDLQRGCVECMALILSRLAASNSKKLKNETFPATAFALINLLIFWIFGSQNGKVCLEASDADAINSRVEILLERMWSKPRGDHLPIQVRICCCNVLLSALSRAEQAVLLSWKAKGFISRIALAAQSCPEEEIVAGGFQILFSFMFKISNLDSPLDDGDLQLAMICFEATAGHLESTRNESVAINGLKVIGVLFGEYPSFVETLRPKILQQLIDRCLITVRDRRISPEVSKLAQSLLLAIAPT